MSIEAPFVLSPFSLTLLKDLMRMASPQGEVTILRFLFFKVDCFGISNEMALENCLVKSFPIPLIGMAFAIFLIKFGRRFFKTVRLAIWRLSLIVLAVSS